MAILKNTNVNNSGAASIPSGTTAQRPIAIYTTPGSYNWTVPTGVTSIKVLVVGGGGSGGGDVGGGGAGGRVIEQTINVTPGQVATFTVGSGGNYPTARYDSYGNTGGTSSFSIGATTITCLGGNGGNGRTGGGNGGVALNNGWNGGGSSYDTSTGTAGVGGYPGGNGNGNSSGSSNGNGGGAGAGGPGQNGFADRNGISASSSPPFGGGDGGLGVWSSISGAPEVYAGGGGGSYYYNQDRSWAGRGTHGGGHGSSAFVNGFGTNGRNGYGCGGGGGPSTGANNNAGLGGSGCVIINWAVSGSLRYNTTFNELELWNGYMYINPQTGTWSGLGKSERTAALSAVQIKENYPQSTSGVYWIHPSNWLESPQQVYCDMETDNGGWMMIGYAGNLSGSDGNWPGRKSTTARERTYWLPLFCTWNEIDSTSRTSGNSFSRPDFARAVGEAGNSSEFMAYRTNNQNNVVIWSAEDITRFGTTNSANWTFPGSPGLIILKFLASRTANIGARILEDKNLNRSIYNTGYTFSRYESGPDYPGIAWNSSFNANSDGDGSFTTFLNRRSILYWETQNNSGSYTDNQWFHASPLELNPSTSPANGGGRLDIGFYFRERKPSVRPIGVLPGLSQDYPAKNALEVLRYWPSAPNGLYWIKPTGYAGDAQQIYCDMEEDGGGWMMVSSNNARDTTIPGGTGRNTSAYQLNRNGTNGALVGSFGISPEGDYIIGNLITTLEYGYARIVAWGRNDLSGTFTYHGRFSPSGRINTTNRGTFVKAVWSIDYTAGAGRETQVVAASNVAITGSVSGSASYFVLDGVKKDGEVSGFGANSNQSTVGGAGVASANGDPQSGCYLGHGTSEGSYEGWYDGSNVPLDCQGYTTWVK